MSFPSSTSATATSFSTSVTSMAVNLPASIASGDLLIAVVSVRNSGTWSTIPTGWTQLFTPVATGGVGDLTVFYKIAAGTEGSTATWIASTGTTGAWHTRKITSWHGTSPPEALTANSGGIAGTAPNPPSLTPSWGSADTLWIEIAGGSAESIVSNTQSTNYTDATWTNVSAGGSSAYVGTATRQLTASSEDPGAYGTTSRWWVAATVAVRPSAGGGTAWTQTSSDSAGLADSSTTAAAYALSLSDGSGLADSVTASPIKFATLSDSMSMTDDVSTALTHVVALTVSDSVGLDEDRKLVKGTTSGGGGGSITQTSAMSYQAGSFPTAGSLTIDVTGSNVILALLYCNTVFAGTIRMFADGNAMTLADSYANPSGQGAYQLYTINTGAMTGTKTVSYDQASGNFNAERMLAAIAVTGGDTTTPVEGFNGNYWQQGNVNTMSDTITSANGVAAFAMDAHYFPTNAPSLTGPTGATVVASNTANSTVKAQLAYLASYTSPATFTWTVDSFNNNTAYGFGVRSGGGGGTTTNTVDLLLSDSVGLAADVSTTLTSGGGGSALTQAANDGAGLADTVQPAASYALSLSDGTGLADTITVAAGYVRSTQDSTGLADTAVAAATFAVTASDGAGLADGAAQAAARATAATDGAGIADTATTAAVFAASTSDSAGLSDTISVAYVAPVVTGTVTTGSNASTNTVTASKPSGVSDGEMLLASVFFRNGPSDGVTGTTNNGSFTRIGPNGLAVAAHELLAKSIPSAAAETATTYTFTAPTGTGSSRNALAVFRVGGVNTSTPVQVQGSVYPNSGGFTLASITTTTNDTLLVLCVAMNWATTQGTINAPAGMTKVVGVQTGSAAFSEMAVFVETRPLAGDTGTRTWSQTGGTGSSSYDAWMFALAPSATPSVAALLTQSSSDLVGLADSVQTSASRVLNLTDGAGIADTVSTAATLSRSASDPTGLADSALTAATFAAAASDGAGLADAALPAAAFATAASDGAGLADGATTAAAHAVTLDDLLPLTEEFNLGGNPNIADDTGLSDSLSLAAVSARTVADATGLSDDVALATGRALSDVAGLADATSFAIARAISESAGVSDQLALDVTLTLADSAGLADTATTGAGRVLTLTDSAGPSDDATTAAGFAWGAQDDAGLLDTATTALALDRTLDDAILVDQGPSTAAGLSRSITDDIGLTDSFTFVGNAAATVADSLGLADDVTAALDIRLSLDDSVHIADVAVPAAYVVVDIFDDAQIFDSLTTTAAFNLQVDDLLAIADAVGGVPATVIFDTCGLRDTVSLAFSIAISETVRLLDSTAIGAPPGPTFVWPLTANDGTTPMRPVDTLTVTDDSKTGIMKRNAFTRLEVR